MNMAEVFPLICGYEQVGDHLRLYVNAPSPVPNFTRERGVRSPLFHLYTGRDAENIMEWLARNRAWQCLRVPPPFCPEQGVEAVLMAANWHCGHDSALLALARNRVITGDAHRDRLRREIRLLIGSVLENPVRDGEFEELQHLEDVINTAPLGVELATTAQIVDKFFGSAG